MHADITTITICDNNMDQFLVRLRDTISSTYYGSNVIENMTINFHGKKILPVDALSAENISVKDDVTFLGTLMDHTLAWGEHVDFVFSELNKTIKGE